MCLRLLHVKGAPDGSHCDRSGQVEHQNPDTIPLTHLFAVLFAHGADSSDHSHMAEVGLLLTQTRKRMKKGNLLDKYDALLVTVTTSLDLAEQLLQFRRFLSLPPTATLSESCMTWRH